MHFKFVLRLFLCALCVLCGENSSRANPPTASYIFPAGARRGTAVDVRVGGLLLHGPVGFELTGRGVKPSALSHASRVWFEGPVLPLPESQQQEDYPADLTGRVVVDRDAPLGAGRGRLFTSQGGAGGLVFVVGDLPEVVENEIAGDALPVPVTLPVTANGRIFPREDIDLYSFAAEAGKTVTAFAHAASLNSPLVPRLEILDAAGTVVAEPTALAVAGADASVTFTPKAAGTFRVRVTDARALGGPAYVYRLTITTAAVPAFEFPLKGDDLPNAKAFDGRLDQPTDWKVELKKGTRYTFDLLARRAGSPLCGVVTVHGGKEVAKAESDGTTDPAPLTFTPAADGVFTVRVTEKFRGRGGPSFVYRLRVTDAATVGESGFRLTVPADVFTVTRGASVSVKLTAERLGGFAGPIAVRAADLPDGVTMTPATLGTNQTAATLVFTATKDVPVGVAALKLRGVALDGLRARAADVVAPGTRFVPEEPALKLAVAFPTPFKIVDQYVMTAAPRGEVYRRKYTIDRGDFTGPIAVRLADKQARHLQGVTGPTLTIPPGETAFEYPATLPPWMEMGRTCRVCVLATATVRDPADGREHAVSFSSTEQNQQMIVVVGPGRLDLAIEKGTVLAVPGAVRIPVKVSRGTNLSGAAKVEVLLPPHIQGVTAAPLTIPAAATAGEVVLTLAADAGPFNMPLTVRATIDTPATPVVAEAKVEVVR